MSSTLPPLGGASPRAGGVTTPRQQALASVMDAASDRQPEQISSWTPHDVAEWLYTQGTKEDHAHTFLAKGIDGPALLGLSRDQLLDWRLKAVDAQSILKGVETLKRLDAGRVGWTPGAFAPELIPAPDLTKPVVPKPPKGKPGGNKPRDTSRRAGGDAAKKQQGATALSKTAPSGASVLGDATAPVGASQAATPRLFETQPEMLAMLPSGERSGGGGSSLRAGHSSSREAKEGKQGGRSYLHTVMSELHSNERVPLWKEEMVERVKRRSTARAEKEAAAMLASASGLSSARLPRASLSARARAGDASETASVSSAGKRAPSKGSAAEHESMRELERKIFWYQDAIHEQELQSQLIEAKQKQLLDQTAELNAQRTARAEQAGVGRGVGALRIEREAQRKLVHEQARLAKCLEVNEERVTDAEKVNTGRIATINELRRGRKDFMVQMRKLDEREASMSADMKHFAQGSNASLDEKEKLEAKLKRQVFEYKMEVNAWEHTVQGLTEELQSLDAAISEAHAAEEAHLEKQRQKQYRALKTSRDGEQKRELRLGYLQNQVRGQEMDFQRLHRIMGVKFMPEKPESVQEIISASLKHEERNQSLLAFVGVQNQQMEELQEELTALTAEAKRLEASRETASETADTEAEQAKKLNESDFKISSAIAAQQAALETLCPAVESLFSLLQCKAPEGDGGLLALKGCRPDTLADHLKSLDIELKSLHLRAMFLPSNADNSLNVRLSGFTLHKVVEANPSVIELRKELEAAAQKQAQAKPEAF